MQALDCFRSSGKFSRKNPESPAAIVCMGYIKPPSLADLMALDAAEDSTQLIFASAAGGTVSFFRLQGSSQSLIVQGP